MESSRSDLRLRKIRKAERRMLSQQPSRRHALTHSCHELIPLYYFLLLFFFFGVSLLVLHVHENSHPIQLSIRESHLNYGRFIGERAEHILNRLTQLGSRVLGSYENEVLTVEFLKREISMISLQANPIHSIEVDFQRATGSYFIVSEERSGYTNCYANVQNVVVKLSSGGNSKSLLLNCNYDTLPDSPGASDNGINCAIMLELLRVMASEKVPLKNTVIFLFNGGGQLQVGSHGFVLQHKWRHQVKAVVNLGSCGAGGKEIMFQTTGENWLIQSFARSVPRPSAAVHAEEILYGVFPSTTSNDFKIFKDFGLYPGLDIAHYRNGYIYGTKHDTTKYIQPGVFQHTGDNLLALVREFGYSKDFGVYKDTTRLVYFDIFNFFVVYYTECSGSIINSLTIVLSVTALMRTLNVISSTTSKESIKGVIISFVVHILSFLTSVITVFLISKILDVFKCTLSWYSRPWLLGPLYVIPVTICWAVISLYLEPLMGNLSSWEKTGKLIIGGHLVWNIVLMVVTFKGYRCSYILMIILLFSNISSLLVTSYRNTFTVKKFIGALIISLILPWLYLLHQFYKAIIFLIPQSTNFGPNVNADLVMGLFTVFALLPFLSQIAPIILVMKNSRLFLVFLIVMYTSTILVLTYKGKWFPYNGDMDQPAFQKFFVFHNERTFYDEKGNVRKTDSGYFFLSTDRNDMKYVLPFIPELNESQSCGDDCFAEVFCGFPVHNPATVRAASRAHWISSDPPSVSKPTTLEVISQTQIYYDTRRIKFKISGPDHMSLGIIPRLTFKLTNWSLGKVESLDEKDEEGKKTYFMLFSYGKDSSLEFDVDFQGTRNVSDTIMDVAIIGHYMHERKFFSPDFNRFLSKFPTWAHVTSWLTTYKSWSL